MKLFISSILPLLASSLPASLISRLQSAVGVGETDFGSFNTCDLGDLDNDCQLDTLPVDTSTLINPSEEFGTSCIDGGNYHFQVFPSPHLTDTDMKNDVLIYFQGGGACWDKLSYDMSLCSKTAGAQATTGLFCRNGSCNSKETNPYEDYTIIHVTYCSGDAHVGQTDRPEWSKRHNVTQRGAPNAQSAIRYITSQRVLMEQGVGKLAIMGCSAGSLGSQAWADEVLYEMDDIGFESSVVIPDSYAGVFPEGSESVTIKDFGACDTILLAEEPELQEKCRNEQVSGLSSETVSHY